MIDGELSALDVSVRRVESSTRVIEAPLTVANLRRIVNAERVNGRVCDVQWSLEAPARDQLREFLHRFDEELAWSRQSTNGGESASASE